MKKISILVAFLLCVSLTAPFALALEDEVVSEDVHGQEEVQVAAAICNHELYVGVHMGDGLGPISHYDDQAHYRPRIEVYKCANCKQTYNYYTGTFASSAHAHEYNSDEHVGILHVSTYICACRRTITKSISCMGHKTGQHIILF